MVTTKKQTRITSQDEQTKDEQDELLTVQEVSRRLRVDDTTVRRWIKNGALEAIGLPARGRRQSYRIKKKTLDALFNDQMVQPTINTSSGI